MVRSRSTAVNGLSVGEVRAEGADVLFMTWLVARGTERLVGDALAPTGLTGDDLAVYSMLASGDGATPTTLARWMAAPPTTVSSVVKRLERRGHAVRTPDPDDRRSYRITLTPTGRDARSAAIRKFAPVRDAIERDLGESLRPVEEALLLLRDAVDRQSDAGRAADAPSPPAG